MAVFQTVQLYLPPPIAAQAGAGAGVLGSPSPVVPPSPESLPPASSPPEPLPGECALEDAEEGLVGFALPSSPGVSFAPGVFLASPSVSAALPAWSASVRGEAEEEAEEDSIADQEPETQAA